MKTAAIFCTRSEFALPVVGTFTPMRCNVEMSVWTGKTVCWLSPVPFRPTTMP